MKGLHKKIGSVALAGAIVLGCVLQGSEVVSFADEIHSPTRFKD